MVFAQITGVGSSKPTEYIQNSTFDGKDFFYAKRIKGDDGKYTVSSKESVAKTENIISTTQINTRITSNKTVPQLGFEALINACGKAAVNAHDIELVIFAHNGGEKGMGAPIPAAAALLQQSFNATAAYDIITTDEELQQQIIGSFLRKGREVQIIFNKNITERTDPWNWRENNFFKLEEIAKTYLANKFTNAQKERFLIVNHENMLKELEVPFAKKVADWKCRTIDIIAGCPGAVVAIDIARHLIEQGEYARIAVIGGDDCTALCPPNDLNITLYGKGASAIILEASEKPGIAWSTVRTYGEHVQAIRTWDWPHSNGNPDSHNRPWMYTGGNEIFELVKKGIADFLEPALKENKWSVEEVVLHFFHQMNGRALANGFGELFERNGMDKWKSLKERVPCTVPNCGNTSTDTVPRVLNSVASGMLSMYNFPQTNKEKGEYSPRIHILMEGDKCVLGSVGAGITYAAAGLIAGKEIGMQRPY